jgi:hypothetical protein
MRIDNGLRSKCIDVLPSPPRLNQESVSKESSLQRDFVNDIINTMSAKCVASSNDSLSTLKLNDLRKLAKDREEQLFVRSEGLKAEEKMNQLKGRALTLCSTADVLRYHCRVNNRFSWPTSVIMSKLASGE